MGLFDHKNLQVSHLKDNKTCRFEMALAVYITE